MKIPNLKQAVDSFEKEYITNTFKLCGEDLEKTAETLGLDVVQILEKTNSLNIIPLKAAFKFRYMRSPNVN